MDNLCKRCYHNYVCEQYNENRDLTRTTCAYKNSHFVDAANVIPVRHGRWLPTTKWWQGGSAWKQCSECGRLHCGTPNYCPNCGAIMDGDRP